MLNIGSFARLEALSNAKNEASGFLSPVFLVSESVMDWIDNISYFLSTAGILNETNQKLVSENQELKARLLVLKALQKENQSLRHALSFNLDRSMYNLKLRRAEVIARYDDLWDSIFIINLGRINYVTKGLPVISSTGLVGSVVEVSEKTAKVRSILDVGSSVSVKALRSGLETVAVGNGSRRLKLKYVPGSAKIIMGEEVVISASSRLPNGVPVGKVSKINGNDMDLFQEVEVTPASDFSRLGILYLVFP